MILNELTMKEFKKGLKRTRTLVVPFGSIEAHGEHLPLNTDTLIIYEAVRRVVERAPAFIAPPVYYGVCTSTAMHPGTITITPETLRRLTSDIVRDSCSKGLENFVLISGHGGSLHVNAMKEAGEALTRELKGVRIAALSVYEILAKEAHAMAETKNDSHAGEIETSLVMHLAPHLVKGTSKEEYPRLPKPVIARDKLKFWPGAVWGDPSKATADKGKRFFESMAASIATLIETIGKARV